MDLDLHKYEAALRDQLWLTVFNWDPAEHPRDLFGRFRAVLEQLADPGDELEEVDLPGNVTVRHVGGKFEIHSSRGVKRTGNLTRAARRALNDAAPPGETDVEKRVRTGKAWASEASWARSKKRRGSLGAKLWNMFTNTAGVTTLYDTPLSFEDYEDALARERLRLGLPHFDFDPTEHPRDLFGKFRDARLPDDTLARQHSSLMTADDKLIMDNYFGTIASADVNAYLRGMDVPGQDPADIQSLVEMIDQAMEDVGPLGRTWTPAGFQMVDRPFSSWRQVADMDFEVGQTFTDKGYGSTSTMNLYHALGEAPGGTNLHLLIDPKVKAIWGANPSEGELLLERGCRYTVQSVVQNEGGGLDVEAVVLPPAD